MKANIQQVRAYHERTKHRLDAYAKGPQYLDWDQQPNPFRRFAGAEVEELPLYSPPFPPLPPQGVQGIKKEVIAALLELSLGLSAWKQLGPDRWALRCNPSSGNLHPTEGYIIATGLDDWQDGVYHYAPHEHALELRGTSAPSPDTAPQCLFGLSSIAWREAWKYGERAFRYVQLDAGHALGAIRYAAAALGLQVELLPVTDAEISTLLGLDRSEDFDGAEAEHPDMLLRIYASPPEQPAFLPTVSEWHGKANSLGGYPHPDWPIIDAVTTATVCTRRGNRRSPSAPLFKPQPDLIPLIRQRRSAQAFSGKHNTLPQDAFYQILTALLPNSNHIPWDAWNLPTRLHPVCFVHRVEGLAPGLYALPRRPEAKAQLQAAMNPDFRWQKPANCPTGLSLYLLLKADARKAARTLSCHQDIASTSAFSLGMLAEFDAGLEEEDTHVYRQFYWEAGLLGQVLYLEAEAVGVRGTGIGCFFDDSVHEVLGLKGSQFQSMYHFTVGSPLTDSRLETLPPYAHLPREHDNDA